MASVRLLCSSNFYSRNHSNRLNKDSIHTLISSCVRVRDQAGPFTLQNSINPVFIHFFGTSTCTPTPCINTSTTKKKGHDGEHHPHTTQQHQSDNDSSPAAVLPILTVHSSLHLENPMPYYRGWAWQHAILNRRLHHLRLQQQLRTKIPNPSSSPTFHASNTSNTSNAAKDQILILEHTPVYTLGRGANEDNLIFLDAEDDGGYQSRLKLSRKAKGGKDSSKLVMDRLESYPGIDEDGNISGCGGDIVQDIIRHGDLDNMVPPATVLAPNQAPIYRIERGGDVTFHGPNQLVVYPLIDLKNNENEMYYRQDLHWYLRQVEEVVILTLEEYGICGVRDEINTGVWVDGKKISAIGISSSRWITTHGFALNVNPNLDYFDTSVIIPCGIEGRDVTSIAQTLSEQDQVNPAIPSLVDVSKVVLEKFQLVFGVSIRYGTELS